MDIGFDFKICGTYFIISVEDDDLSVNPFPFSSFPPEPLILSFWPGKDVD